MKKPYLFLILFVLILIVLAYFNNIRLDKNRLIQHEIFIKEKQVYDSINNISEQKLIEAKQARQAKERAERMALGPKGKRLQYLIDKFGEEIAPIIAEKKVRIGMTSQMCIESWGKPNKINRTTSSHRTDEQWVYDSGSYLYFEDDILTTIQN